MNTKLHRTLRFIKVERKKDQPSEKTSLPLELASSPLISAKNKVDSRNCILIAFGRYISLDQEKLLDITRQQTVPSFVTPRKCSLKKQPFDVERTKRSVFAISKING